MMSSALSSEIAISDSLNCLRRPFLALLVEVGQAQYHHLSQMFHLREVVVLPLQECLVAVTLVALLSTARRVDHAFTTGTIPLQGGNVPIVALSFGC